MFTIDFTLNELQFIRQALDVVNITGKDAKFLSALQTKTEGEINQIIQMLQTEETRKSKELASLLKAEELKPTSEKIPKSK